jgi:hypothetical protein
MSITSSTTSLAEHPPAPLRVGSSWEVVRALWSRAVERLGAVMVVFFALVVVASGFSAIVLLGWPGSTDTTFSWTLRPDAAAALIGGLYLVSAVAFSYALTRTWTEVKGLWIAVYGLAVPTFVATLVHNEVFDFSRWQALAWLAIFTGAPIAVTAVLVAKRHEHPPAEGRRPMALLVRLVLAAMALVLATLGVLLMLDPTRGELSEHSPFALIGLTGAYLGAWCAFAALLAAWSAWCNDWRQARVPMLTLAALPVGALLAMARVPDAASFAYAGALVAVTAVSVACLATDRR